MGIRDRPTSPRSPWQNGYAERLIGSIRRECLDHVVVLSERHLRHLLLCYMKYYNGARTHLSLDKDAPVLRAVDRARHILCRPVLGGTASPIWPDLIYDRHNGTVTSENRALRIQAFPKTRPSYTHAGCERFCKPLGNSRIERGAVCKTTSVISRAWPRNG
jgi:hypothetical protein